MFGPGWLAERPTTMNDIWRTTTCYRVVLLTSCHHKAQPVLEGWGDCTFARSTYVSEDRSTFLAIRRRAGGQHELGDVLLTANLKQIENSDS